MTPTGLCFHEHFVQQSTLLGGIRNLGHRPQPAFREEAEDRGILAAQQPLHEVSRQPCQQGEVVRNHYSADAEVFGYLGVRLARRQAELLLKPFGDDNGVLTLLAAQECLPGPLTWCRALEGIRFLAWLEALTSVSVSREVAAA